VAIFVTGAPAKSVARSFPLSKGLSLNAVTTECKQMEEHPVLPTQFLNVSIIVSTLCYQLKTKHGKSLGEKRNIIGELCSLIIEFR
jgi:hypothetical protein